MFDYFDARKRLMTTDIVSLYMYIRMMCIGVGAGGGDRGIGPPLLGRGDNPPNFSDALVTIFAC